MAELSEDQSKKLQEGIAVLNTILSRSSSESARATQDSHPPEASVQGPGPCSRALQALRSVRRLYPSDDAKKEQRTNFAPYSLQRAGSSTHRGKGKGKGKARLQSWTLKMVCLSGTGDHRVPSSVAARETLLEAGLGEKKVLLADIECSKEEFWETITSTFPKLKDCGGFELLRCVANTKGLDVVSPNIAQSPVLLKTVLGNARVYIRPIQRDLDLDPLEGSSTPEMEEKCVHCNGKIPLSKLRKHAQRCRFERLDTQFSSDEDFEPTSRTQRSDERSATSTIVLSDCDDEEDDTVNDVVETENALIDHALTMSETPLTQQPMLSMPSEDLSRTTLKGLLRNLSSQVKEDVVMIPVRRGYVLLDALRTVRRITFSCAKTVRVQFLGEEGEDGGGPSREFWSLLAKDVSESLFEGRENAKVLRHDSLALQDNKFYHVGNLLAMGVVQMGTAFPFFAPSTYAYLCGSPLSAIEIPLTDVASYEVTDLLRMVMDASDDGTLRQVCLAEADAIIESGYSKPICTITLAEKEELVRVVKLHYTLLRNKAETDQLKRGLSILGLGEALETHTNLLQPMFLAEKSTPLTADAITELFKKFYYSPTGSTEYEKEQATYMLFLDLLYDAERLQSSQDGSFTPGATLSTVLAFFTGTERIPVLGFDYPPCVRFSATTIFPTASTCALELTLPTRYFNQPELFKEKITYAMLNHGGFGVK